MLYVYIITNKAYTYNYIIKKNLNLDIKKKLSNENNFLTSINLEGKQILYDYPINCLWINIKKEGKK
ncbi:hypothetical protein PFUGPA_01567 [Plasmodium falciparum Palo Alto/Uganda]|uniref:Uncharacterized protein n=1 Tax=Plasmodium falciparum (isolate Palo Alto / Uganda) TaxID=57270 RepID=W4J464_PLAFP|nr:hypothetical protein PFUGPA_01567 [Plasmodium falciparum Palo Alto/Uganda]